MATIIGTPGASAVVRAGRIALLFILAAVLLLAILLLEYAVGMNRASIAAGLLMVAVLLFLVWWRRSEYLDSFGVGFPKARKPVDPAISSQRVHQQLAGLPDTSVVFHDYSPAVPGGVLAAWSVDHIVVGATGVFVIESRHYRESRVPTATRDRSVLRTVRRAERYASDVRGALSRWASDDLSDVPVVPMVVYTQDDAEIEQRHEDNVRVLTLAELRGEIDAGSGTPIDRQTAARAATALFTQLEPERQAPYRSDLTAYLKRCNAERRYADRGLIRTSGPGGPTAGTEPVAN